jgi:hypothetical protein
MENPFQSMIALDDDWLIASAPPAGDPITAEPATTLPPVGSTGAAACAPSGARAVVARANANIFDVFMTNLPNSKMLEPPTQLAGGCSVGGPLGLDCQVLVKSKPA